MKNHLLPVYRSIIRLLLTTGVLASVLTPAEAQTFLPVNALDVVDADGDKVGVFYPSPPPSPAFGGEFLDRLSEGFVPFFHRRQLFLLRFTTQNGFRKNGVAFFTHARCESLPMMVVGRDTGQFVVAPPHQTVYYNRPGLPVEDRTIRASMREGVCTATTPSLQQVTFPEPLIRLTRVFTPPFRIRVRR